MPNISLNLIENLDHYTCNPSKRNWLPSDIPSIIDIQQPLGYLQKYSEHNGYITNNYKNDYGKYLDNIHYYNELCEVESLYSLDFDPRIAGYIVRLYAKYLKNKNTLLPRYLCNISSFIYYCQINEDTHTPPISSQLFDAYASNLRYITDTFKIGSKKYNQAMNKNSKLIGSCRVQLLEEELAIATGARNISVFPKNNISEQWQKIINGDDYSRKDILNLTLFNVTLDYDYPLYESIMLDYDAFKNSYKDHKYLVFDNDSGNNLIFFVESVLRTTINTIKSAISNSLLGTIYNSDIVIMNLSEWVDSFMEFIKQVAAYYSSNGVKRVMRPIPLRLNFDWLTNRMITFRSSDIPISSLIDRGAYFKESFEIIKEGLFDETIQINPISEMDIRYEFAPQIWNKLFQVKFRVNRFNERGECIGDLIKGKELIRRTSKEISAFNSLYDSFGFFRSISSSPAFSKKERDFELDHDWLIYYYAFMEPVS